MRRTEITIPPSEPTQRAYLAGIIDGEGHVLCRRRAGQRHLNIGLVLCMADTAVLDWVHAHFAGTYSGTWINEKTGARPRRIWKITRAADLAALLPQITPFMVLKRREAEIVALLAEHSLSTDDFTPHGRNDRWHARTDALYKEFRKAFRARG